MPIPIKNLTTLHLEFDALVYQTDVLTWAKKKVTFYFRQDFFIPYLHFLYDPTVKQIK